MIGFRRTKLDKLVWMLFIVSMPGMAQTKVSLRQLDAHGFSNGCIVATSGALSTQSCGSGSDGDAGGYTVLNFSSTPVFPLTKNTAQSFLLTLTGDVASSTVDASGLTSSGRPIVTFRLCQDGAGSHAFAWPASVQYHGTIDPRPGACSTQTFVFDGTNLQALGNLMITNSAGDAITLPGLTSGATILQASSVADGTLTFPARTATVATTSGPLGTGHCAQYDAAGNLTDAGSPCAAGGGSFIPNPPFLATIGGTNYVIPYMVQPTLFDTTGFSNLLGAASATTLSNGVVNLVSDATGAPNWYGRTVTGGITRLTTAIACDSFGGAYAQCGVFVADHAGKAVLFYFGTDNAGKPTQAVDSEAYSDQSGWQNYKLGAGVYTVPVYLRVDWATSSILFDVSVDGGITWSHFYALDKGYGQITTVDRVGFNVVSSQPTSGAVLTSMDIIHWSLQ